MHCHVVAPSLVPVKAGDRVKADHRESHKDKRILVSVMRQACGRSRDLSATRLRTDDDLDGEPARLYPRISA